MDSGNYILDSSAWLYFEIFRNEFIYLDLWSLIYLWGGFMVTLAARAYCLKRPLAITATVIVIFEAIEVCLDLTGLRIFHPETIPDKATDIILGISGGTFALVFLLIVKRHSARLPHLIHFMIMFIASTSWAFLWVGSYRYHYNAESYNTPGINLSTFSAWTTGGVLILVIFRWLKKYKLMVRLAVTWLIYFTGLLIFEYVYYYILEVRETSGYPLKPLVFGLIHGTPALHFFYIAAPFIFVSIYLVVFWLVRRNSDPTVAE